MQAKLEKLERTSKTSDIDIWLNSWIQLESIAKTSKYSWSGDVIDRFHAALGRRSIFFATSFAAQIWMGAITLSQLAEQYRLCEAKLKRFDYVGARDFDIFTPPVSLATANQKAHESKNEKISKGKGNSKGLCGIRHHTLKECYLFNVNSRPEGWTDRRSIVSKEKLYNLLTNNEKKLEIEKELGHRIPSDLLEKTIRESCSATSTFDDIDLHNSTTESQMTREDFPQCSYMLALATSERSLPYKDWWVFDSGSGRHICHKKELFWTYKPLKTHQIITTGAGNCSVEGVGSIVLYVTTPNGVGTLKIEGVLYVPRFMTNIVSMDRIKDQMMIWDHSENWLTHWDTSRTHVAKIWNQFNQNFISKKAVYPNVTKVVTDIPESISTDTVIPNSFLATKVSSVRNLSSADVVIWHRRLGHPCPNTIKRLSNVVDGVKVTGSYDGCCEECLLTKSKRMVSRIPSDRGKNFWTRIHVDIIVFQSAWNGDRYALHAYDAKGHGHLVDTLASKDQLKLMTSVMNMLRKLKNEGRTIQFFHSDNEKGFASQFQQMLKDNGIVFEPTVRYTPEQNGFEESSGNRICVVARALRIQSGFP